MSLRTKEPRYQASPTLSSSRRYLTSEFFGGLPGEIRCRPKHSTTCIAGFVAARRTPSTQTFLSQLIVPTNLIYRGRCARATPCAWVLKIFSVFMSPTLSKPHRVTTLRNRPCWQRRGAPGGPPNPHRAGVAVGCRGLDPRHCRPVHAVETKVSSVL